MTDYELPPLPETPEQAGQEVNRFVASCFDNPKHPYLDGNNPQHGDFQKRVRELYLKQEEGEDSRTPHEKDVDAIMERTEKIHLAEKETLHSEFDRELAALHELGFSGPVYDPVTPVLIEGLKMQRLNEIGEQRELSLLLTKGLHETGADASVIDQMQSFVGSNYFDPELKKQIVALAIANIYENRKGKK